MTDTVNDIWHDRRVNIGYETAEELAKKLNPANFRGHPESQADALDDSLDLLGWVGSVKLNINTNRIFDGELRIKRTLVKDPSIPIPVDYYDLTPDEELLALQVHDAITEQAEPIADKLAALLERTRGMTADWPALGAMLERLKERAGISGNGQPTPEPSAPTEIEAEKYHKKWQVLPGEIWKCGQHLIACLDSLDEANIKRVVERAPDAIWADAPYGMNLDTDWEDAVSSLTILEGKGIRGGRKYAPVEGDDKDFDPMTIPFLLESKESFLWGADYYAERLPNKNDGSWFVWDKRLDEDADRMYGSCFELCWSKVRHKRDIARIKWAGVFGVEQEPERKRFHPTQKPVKLFEWFAERYFKDGWLIFDPFLGSGQSVLGAEKTGRGLKVIGFEVEPMYMSVVLQRWVDLTGGKPTLIKQGH